MSFNTVTGELEISPRWSLCVICKMPTSQPPVCCSPICEARLERRMEAES